MMNDGVHLQAARQGFEKAARIGGGISVILGFVGEQAWIFPDRHAVLAPITAECPARQRLARIPLALSEMQ